MKKTTNKSISRAKWIWMPHPAHFICARDCQFFLATKVGKYIVSTVGEYYPDSAIRKIYAETRKLNIPPNLIGDYWDAAYRKAAENHGYEELHFGGWLYETMVFPVKRAPKGDEDQCCPWRAVTSQPKAELVYKTRREAFLGHYVLCNKFARK